MKAKLNYKSRGIREGDYNWTECGEISVFPNGGYSQNGSVPFINVNAFQGSGDTYTRRPGSCLISINNGSKSIFMGTFQELETKLRQAEVFEHDKWWHLITAADLTDSDREHIARLIEEGCTNGEIIHEEDEEEL